MDGFNFLLDCGWDETFDMVFINNLKKVRQLMLKAVGCSGSFASDWDAPSSWTRCEGAKMMAVVHLTWFLIPGSY